MECVAELPMHMADGVADLVVSARGGDRDAYGRLVERFWAELVAFARAVLAADLEAEDAVQDALVEAWRQLGRLRDPAAFRPWVRRAVFRRALKARRLAGRSEPLDTSDPAGGERPDGAVLVTQALALLSPRQRAVAYLSWVEGCTDTEVARSLGMMPPTVRVQRARAAARLRAALGERR